MASVSSPSSRDTTVAILETDEQTARRIAGLFAESFAAGELAVSLVDGGRGNWSVTVYFGAAVDKATVRDVAAAAGGAKVSGALRFARVAARDWVGDTLAGLRPVTAGRFVVHGAHDSARIAVNRIGIEIEAALAFGTGHHGTTRGCLLALDRLCKETGKRRRFVRRHPEVRAISAPRRMSARALRGSSRSLSSGRPKAGPVGAEHLRVTARKLSILDLGTGSGVLAIAAARALHAPVLATDIDAAAVRAARDNARRNRVGAMVAVVRADGVAAAAIR
ncbi:MAG TPA: 50S ribosomal protein L11 methyltransferase, partial [Xanthobacteraceae bacterium]|nr:50S ribosomal protein L11 methyltransferase [Xanthobacteraceae bacterium]